MATALRAAFSRRLWQACLFCFVALGFFSRAASADPALWVLRDADSTIYLFGTIHAMKPTVSWRNAKIDQAFAASSELWVEETGDDDQALMGRLVAAYGLDPQHPISAKLTPPQRARFAKASQVMGLNLMTMEQLRPWLAAITLTSASLVKAGYDPDKGIDHSLEQAAKAAGKPIKSFETPEQQIQIFANLMPQEELMLLTQILEEVDQGPAYFAKLSSAWLRGDTATLDQELSADMRDQSPALYKAVFLDRNVNFTKHIEEMMAGKGTAFIAVGAAHLIGQDSVINMLDRDGYKAERE